MYLFHSNAWMQCEIFHTDLCPQFKVCRLQKGMVIIMDVNGLTNTMSAAVSDIKNVKTDTAAKTDSTQTKDNNTDQATATTPKQDDTAAVYDKSKLSEDDRKTIVEQLKADQEKRQTQLTDLVKNMMSKQAATFGQATDIWKFLAKGDFTVDAETKAKAQKDIAEDGYWGVEQTSDRIVSFATDKNHGKPISPDNKADQVKRKIAQTRKNRLIQFSPAQTKQDAEQKQRQSFNLVLHSTAPFLSRFAQLV